MNNTLANQEQPTPKNKEMNDIDYLNDMLSTEKRLITNYAIAQIEASNDFLYQEIANINQETNIMQRNLFNLLFKKGWYKLEKAEEQKINTVLGEQENKLNELP